MKCDGERRGGGRETKEAKYGSEKSVVRGAKDKVLVGFQKHWNH